MKKIFKYIIAFIFSVGGGTALLLLATFAPQEMVDHHIQESIIGLTIETSYPAVWDRSDSAVLDNFTDALILMESKAMVSDSKSTIFTNPMYMFGKEDPVEALEEYAYSIKPTPSSYYTRYWMGFRAVIRWLLTFLDYFQIRRYMGVVFFVLMFSLMNSMSKHLSRWHSLVFALSILMVRPQVISTSLQYSCCFLIAFFAMLLVPWIHKNPKFQGIFFMELGMMTMYFDFYTTPLITFGLPMIYLCLLRIGEHRKIRVQDVIKNVFIWLAGYVGMWVSKLVLTDLFTDKPGIVDALNSVRYRLGLSSNRIENSEEYSIARALQRVWEIVLPDHEAVVVFWVLLVAVLLLVAWRWHRKELNFSRAQNGLGMLVIACLPIVWFCVTAQPIIIHAMFQYRSIVVLFWAMGAYLCLILEKTDVFEKNLVYSEK